jgi:hypothetical protein
MDKQTRTMICEDFEEASKYLVEILKGEVPNFEVVGEDYITPTIRSPTLPLDHERSSILYYSRIVDALKETLITGICPVQLSHAPNYLQKLFK